MKIEDLPSELDICATSEPDSIHVSDLEIRIDDALWRIELVLENRTSTTHEAHIEVFAEQHMMKIDEFDVKVPAKSVKQMRSLLIYTPEYENAIDELKELYVKGDITLERFEEYLEKAIVLGQEQQT